MTLGASSSCVLKKELKGTFGDSKVAITCTTKQAKDTRLGACLSIHGLLHEHKQSVQGLD